ncbi:MAG: cytochrome B [Acidimicrobiia bacterium]|nr:cytochrome B [Acidimicrobiia bacterium]
MSDENRRVRVWDPFVRTAHWVLAAAFFAAYAIEDAWMSAHAWLGYLAGAIVIVRALWGMVGPRHARFADFLYPPRVVLGYLADLAAFRAQRYLGHSPAGGAIAVALWLGVAASVASGIVAYAYQGKGPLAPYFGPAAQVASAQVSAALALVSPAYANDDEGKRAKDKTPKSRAAKAWEEIHEAFATLTLWLVVVHIGGVLWASLVHRENLTRGMIDGFKWADQGPEAPRAGP